MTTGRINQVTIFFPGASSPEGRAPWEPPKGRKVTRIGAHQEVKPSQEEPTARTQPAARWLFDCPHRTSERGGPPWGSRPSLAARHRTTRHIPLSRKVSIANHAPKGGYRRENACQRYWLIDIDHWPAIHRPVMLPASLN